MLFRSSGTGWALGSDTCAASGQIVVVNAAMKDRRNMPGANTSPRRPASAGARILFPPARRAATFARVANDARTRKTRRDWLPIIALVLVADALGGWLYYCHWREHSQDAVIRAAAARYGVDGALVKAVVWRESWFDPAARGRRSNLVTDNVRAAVNGIAAGMKTTG